ncbi:hypothetical protein [Hydrogenophaga sp.]|uniref:hypothetical protein n=1 Tax=Hydrogenophaga sp. TaxID=1904254 RepID=UPI003D148236
MPTLNILYHPAVQSLVLPPLLAWLGVLLLRALAGARWAPLGAALGLLAALAALPGFDWPALSRVQKLPWLVLVATVLAGAWLGLSPPGSGHRRLRGVALAAGLTMALLALAAAAALGGSLLLAQLAVMLAATTAVPGLWAWWRPASGLRVPLAALLPMLVGGLFVAFALFAAQQPGPGGRDDSDPYYTPQWK